MNVAAPSWGPLSGLDGPVPLCKTPDFDRWQSYKILEVSGAFQHFFGPRLFPTRNMMIQNADWQRQWEITRWWQLKDSNMFYFHPKNWGRFSCLSNIFQLGWFNHHLGYLLHKPVQMCQLASRRVYADTLCTAYCILKIEACRCCATGWTWWRKKGASVPGLMHRSRLDTMWCIRLYSCCEI